MVTPIVNHPKPAEILGAVPATVRAQAEKVMARFGTNKVSYASHTPGSNIYFAEDASYWLSRDGIEWLYVKMGGEWGGVQPADEALLNTYREMPVGAWVIEAEYFCGRPVVRVQHWNGQAVLA